MQYLNYLNHPLINIITNFILIFPFIIISLSNNHKNNYLLSYKIIISTSISLLLMNLSLMILLFYNLMNLSLIIPLIFYIYAMYKIYFYKKIFFINVNKIKEILQINSSEKTWIITLLSLLGITSQITALDSDSFLYHLAFPFKLIQSNFEYYNLSWYHLNLLSYSELNNLYGLLFKSETFVSTLNFIYFVFFTFFIFELIKKNNLKIPIIIFFSFPIYFFFISSQKFFFVPTTIIICFIVNSIFYKKIFMYKEYLVLYYAVFTKFTFFFYPIIFFVYEILKYRNKKKIFEITKLNFLSSIPIIVIFYFFRYEFTTHPFFPIKINTTFDNIIFLEWFDQMSNYMAFDLVNFINIYVPNSLSSLSSFLGISILFVILSLVYSKNIQKILIISLFIFSFFFIQASARFYFCLTIITIFIFIFNEDLTRHILLNKTIKLIAYLQSFVLFTICIYAISNFGQSIYSDKGRSSVLNKYGYDFSAINSINEHIEKYNLDRRYIFISRSNLFSINEFISYEMTSTVLSEKQEFFYKIYDNYITQNGINSIIASKDVFENYEFLNCIKDNEIYKSDEFEISSRNNFNKSKRIYMLYSLKDDISGCY